MGENFGEDIFEFDSIDLKAVGLVDLLSVGRSPWVHRIENLLKAAIRRDQSGRNGCGETNADQTPELHPFKVFWEYLLTHQIN